MKLIFATQNENKVAEIQKLMPKHIEVLSLKDIHCADDIPEEEPTLEGNALVKARFIAEKYNVNCFSDDTGLEIDALDGAPGVISARYAGEEKNSEKNMDLVLKNLANQTNRKAQFRTAIALIANGKEHVFEGIVKGEIRTEKTGSQGFGYDPIFEPENCGKTFAEMSTTEKNKMSHRGRALEKMVQFLATLTE
jgi:XTP/dITP diphosphohydrolase